ncbi:MAG: hypothetical protein ACFE0O_15585 [Opitutales bacterium]
MPNNWAVICGAVRDDLDFKLTVAELVGLRSRGLLDGLILSTWEGEVEAWDGLSEALADLGVAVIASRDVPVAGPANYWRQLKAFHVGLQATPAGCGVLKTRTDKVVSLLAGLVPYLQKGPRPATAYGRQEPVFQHRLGVLHAVATMPGTTSDLMFYGTRADLERVAHLDGHMDNCAYQPKLNPCFSWINTPAAPVFPILREALEHIDPNALSNALVRYGLEGKGDELPDYLVRLLAAGFVLYGTSLDVVGPPRCPDSLTLEILLGHREKQPGVNSKFRTATAKTIFKSQEPLRRLLAGDWGADASPDGLRLKEAMDAIASGTPAGRCLTQSRMDAVRAFLDRWAPANRPSCRSAPVIPLDAPLASTIRSREDALARLGMQPSGIRMSDGETAVINRLLARSSALQKRTERTVVDIAERYLAGNELPVDPEKAVLWAKRAADRKFPSAQFLLGKCFRDGLGVKPSEERAALWFGRAAQRNYPPAQYAFGRLLEKGEDPPRGRALIAEAEKAGYRPGGAGAEEDCHE